MREPSRQASNGEHDGEHIGRNAQSAVDDAAVEVHVGIQLALDEIGILQGRLFHRARDVEQRILDLQPGQHLVTRRLDNLRPRVVVLVHTVAKAHQLEARILLLGQVDELLRPAAVTVDFAQHIKHALVGPAVQRPPQGANAGRNRCEHVRLRTAHQAHRRGAAVLFVVGVQDQNLIQDLDDLLVDLVGPRGNREHHVEEVRAVAKVVLRIHEGFAHRLLVGIGGDGAHLRQQMRDGRLILLGIIHLERVWVEARQRANHGRKNRHRVGRDGIAVEEVAHILVQSRIHGQERREPAEFLRRGQPAVDEKVGDLDEGGLLGRGSAKCPRRHR